MADDPLDFGVDFGEVEDRLLALGYFLSVTDVLEAAEALDETVPARPPAAFIGTGRERAEPNRLIGGHAQRVPIIIAVLFVESAARMDRQAKHQMELTKRAIIRQLVAWQPRGALAGLEYDGYRVVAVGNGLAWGEVTFATSYRLHI